MLLRVGLGSDLHRTATERPLILGGVTIPHVKGLEGHSDADALLHAITDALLGATGKGDIGELFPDTDDKWKGANSAELLSHVLKLIRGDGWKIVNLDCTISAQKPKLSPHKPAIRQRVAELLEISPELVNIKAKTGERVGPIGREEAIATHAIVLLQQGE